MADYKIIKDFFYVVGKLDDLSTFDLASISNEKLDQAVNILNKVFIDLMIGGEK